MCLCADAFSLPQTKLIVQLTVRSPSARGHSLAIAVHPVPVQGRPAVPRNAHLPLPLAALNQELTDVVGKSPRPPAPAYSTLSPGAPGRIEPQLPTKVTFSITCP